MLEPAPVHRIVRPVFGSAASLGVIGTISHKAIAACFTRLEEIEERFSTYRPTSEISRIRDGLLHLHDAHVETRHFEYHGENRGDLLMTKEKLLANADRFEAQIAADRAALARYR